MSDGEKFKISTWMREASSRDSPVPVNLLVLAGTVFTSEGHGNLLSYFSDILVFLMVQKVLGVGTIPDLDTLEDFHVIEITYR